MSYDILCALAKANITWNLVPSTHTWSRHERARP